MLSNTEESRPRPKADLQDGSGRPLTGINDAAATRATRKIAPLAAGFATFQSGFAMKLVSRIAAQGAMPSQGAVSSPSLRAFAVILAATAADRMIATIQILRH